MTLCRNCDTALEASFCPACGQRKINLERPLPELLGEVLRETFDVDGREFRTLKMLFCRPGMLTSEFLAGRRRHYTPPLRLYLAISVLFFVVAAWVVDQGMLLHDGQSLEANAAEQARLIGDALPRLMFVLLPVFALLLKIAFRQHFYFNHLIHALHLHCSAYLVLSVMLPLERAADQSWLMMAVQFVFVLYLFASFVISLKHVYREGWRVTSGKALGIFLLYMVLVAVSFDLTSHLAAS